MWWVGRRCKPAAFFLRRVTLPKGPNGHGATLITDKYDDNGNRRVMAK